MKKTLIILTLIACISMVGCQGNKNNSVASDSEETSSSVQSDASDADKDENKEKAESENSDIDLKDDKKSEESNNAQKEAKVKETLSNDLFSFEMFLNDKKYKLPFEFKDMSSNGYVFEKTSDDSWLNSLEANATSMDKRVFLGNKTLDIYLKNYSSSKLAYENCKVTGYIIESSDIASGTKIELPKNINMNSTKQEVINAYGNPTDVLNHPDGIYVRYIKSVDESVHFVFDVNTGKMRKIEIHKNN